MKTAIHKTVMRRVYYSYALSVLSQPTLWQGLLLGACIALFGRLTHVASIAHNFAATRVENTPAFIWNGFVNAYTNGEVLTVLVVLFMIGLAVSCTVRLVPLLVGRELRVA
jgi:cell division protein FtsX